MSSRRSAIYENYDRNHFAFPSYHDPVHLYRKYSQKERQNESEKQEDVISSVIPKNNTKRPASQISSRSYRERDRSISFGNESSGTTKRLGTKSSKGEMFAAESYTVTFYDFYY